MGVTVRGKIKEDSTVKNGLAPGADVPAFFFAGFQTHGACAENRGNSFGCAGSKV